MENPIQELQIAQSLLLALAEDADTQTWRRQYHPDLAPLGWQLGHCVYVECLWLHERIRGDDSVTAPIADFYTPGRQAPEDLESRLPPQPALLTWAREIQAFNRHFLAEMPPQWRTHALVRDDALLHYLVQHHSRHYETMLMILSQKALRETRPNGFAPAPLHAAAPRDDQVEIPGGHYRIGTALPAGSDTEAPPQHAQLGDFSIARYPVSNAEYLGFMEDGGYSREALWEPAGWRWVQDHKIQAPDHWRLSDSGAWYGIGMRGPYELAADEPVAGISRFEAAAYARWAGARLPHEYQWEAACRSGVLQQTGRVWEWCENPFQAYEGYRPFPDPETPESRFDEHHYSLRGGCLHTRRAIKRPSYRTGFQPDRRHMFAGLRLVY